MVERRSGFAFAPARPFAFTTIADPLGWHRCEDGTWFYGLHILSGRVKDAPGRPLKTALREIAAQFATDAVNRQAKRTIRNLEHLEATTA